MVYIYTLKLKQGKYYVGKTSHPNFRIESHFNSEGSGWTKMYNPIKILEIIPNCDDYDEDKYTKIYMDKYGIDNVRGGSYTSVKVALKVTLLIKALLHVMFVGKMTIKKKNVSLFIGIVVNVIRNLIQKHLVLIMNIIVKIK